MTFFRTLLCTACVGLGLGLPVQADTITIFAASSMKTVVDEIIQQSGLNAVAAYGGSAAIARQVAQGADADIVILAHPEWMDRLQAQGALADESRCDVIGNELVLVGLTDRPALQPKNAQDLIDALNGGRLAVGQLFAVPAGQYTAAFLETRGWLDALRPHLAQTSNVRLALALVARGQAPLGFVYGSDVVAQPRVQRIFTPDRASYPVIRYPAARTITADAASIEMWNALIKAGSVFEDHGFTALPPDDPNACPS